MTVLRITDQDGHHPGTVRIAYIIRTVWGVAQLLRWKANGHNNDGTNTVAYDLIFGNKDTKKYYAQFAKQHKTHLFEQIKQSNDQQFTFVKNQKS